MCVFRRLCESKIHICKIIIHIITPQNQHIYRIRIRNTNKKSNQKYKLKNEKDKENETL